MKSRAIAAGFAIAASVAACSDDRASVHHWGATTCRSLADRAATTDGYLADLSNDCLQALEDVTKAENLLAAFRAGVFLDDISRLERALARLPSTPTDTGAYLIAREIGVVASRAGWLEARPPRERSGA